ncbi:MAG: hypothetical protein LUQ36_00605, partial [Methanoregula sp.]|nr:hypothetical protein [Methanoregula sp.]
MLTGVSPTALRLPPNVITPEQGIQPLSPSTGAVWRDRHCLLRHSICAFFISYPDKRNSPEPK